MSFKGEKMHFTHSDGSDSEFLNGGQVQVEKVYTIVYARTILS